jgi:hypothetical protein
VNCGIRGFLWKSSARAHFAVALVSASGAEIADRLLSLAVLEEFDLAQALFGFGFALVGAAEILALFGKHFVAFFHFLDHFLTSDFILGDSGLCAMPELL